MLLASITDMCRAQSGVSRIMRNDNTFSKNYTKEGLQQHLHDIDISTINFEIALLILFISS